LEKMRAAGLQQPALIGTPAEIRDMIDAYREAGVDEVIVPDFTLGDHTQKLATMDTFITAVAGR